MRANRTSHDTHPAAARGPCVWVLGAPGLGKSTVAEALKQAFRAPIIELGDLRGMHLLDPAYGDANDAEAALAFAHQVYLARSYLAHGYPCVFATDLPQAESARLPEVVAAGLPSRVLTLVIRDPEEHRRRVLGLAGPRDSGFVHVEWAARWNADELARPPWPYEHRLDTTGLTSDETVAAARAVVAAWLADD